MKPIVRPKQHSIKDIYAAYVDKLLKAHPTWWGKYEKSLRRKNCYIYAKEDGKVVLKMSWQIWKEIIETFYYKAKQSIIEGETLKMGMVGKIRGARIQRDYTKPVVDWHATFTMKIPGADGKFKKIFRTEEDYCRIEWSKLKMIPNETSYHFQAASKNTVNKKGFKAEFVQALQADPMLKYRYKYYPLKLQECNTSIPASGTS